MLKWNVQKVPNEELYRIKNAYKTIVTGISQLDAERIAAAHNAVIDMAFDSPGNVS